MADFLNSQEQKGSPIKLISECFVKPKYEVEAAKHPHHLSPSEILMLTIDPIQKGLLFTLNNPTSTDDRTKVVSHLLEKLKQSLCFALVHFYPLAGRFATQKYPDEHASSIFIDCTKGPGARLIYATAVDVSVSDILSSADVPPIIQSFFELGEKSRNIDGYTKALLSIQVTELIDGVFIGFTMNHGVVDGTSFIHFVSMLSEIFRSELTSDSTTIEISRVPVFNCKPWIKNISENKDAAVLKLPYLPEEFKVQEPEPELLRERIFHFSPSSLATLKAKANKECETNNVMSTFQALSALVWRCITRARNLSSNQLTSCFMLINARNRFNPPLSDNCFGNFVSRAQLICNIDELLSHDLGWVAMNLRQAILAQDEKTVIGLYEEFTKFLTISQPGVVPDLHGPNSVVIGGSARFDMYGPEFGLGRALAVQMGYANKTDGKVTANPGREGKGSVDLEICLRPHFMAALEADLEFMSLVSVH